MLSPLFCVKICGAHNILYLPFFTDWFPLQVLSKVSFKTLTAALLVLPSFVLFYMSSCLAAFSGIKYVDCEGNRQTTKSTPIECSVYKLYTVCVVE